MAETPPMLVDAPEPIATALRKSKFNPAAARKEFSDGQKMWRLYLDLMELDADKLKSLLDRHGDETTEDTKKYETRQQMAVIFNLIPSIINMIVGYLFAEEPILSDGGDEDIRSFLDNADGQGTPFKDWLRLQGLPLSLVLGWIDGLVQNPLPAGNDPPDEAAKPVLYAITPLQRINWSCDPAGRYNWIAFKDLAGEDASPLAEDIKPQEAYIRISAAHEATGGAGKPGFWIRSWQGIDPAAKSNQSVNVTTPQWSHRANYTPTERCCIEPLYYRQSIDPLKRHTGVSKIAMMAVLTRCILNVLSWTQEDMLANLAILALPSKGGKRPTADDGSPINPTLTPTTILWFDPENAGTPMVVQGDVAHIRIKMEFVAALIQEILRLSHMMGVSAETQTVTSGIMGMVERNELFQELSQLAGGLDTFSYGVLALVKSWATGTDWTVERLQKEIPNLAVDFHKGPYTLDPLADVITNAKAVLGMFARISPTMGNAALKYAARAFLYANDPDLKIVLDEIQKAGADENELLAAASDPNKVAAAVVPNQLGKTGTQPAAGGATPPKPAGFPAAI
jgi:hypothetical protein